MFVVPERLALRTTAIAIPGIAGLAVFMFLKYGGFYRISADILTTIGVSAQLILPMVYLVSVELNGYASSVTLPYIDFFPEAVLAAVLGQFCFLIGYEIREWNSRWEPWVAVHPNVIELRPYFLAMLPLIMAVWIARGILVATGSYYWLLRSDFMTESAWYSQLAQLNSYGGIVPAALWASVFVVQPAHRFHVLPSALLFTALELAWYLPAGGREPILGCFVLVLMAYIFGTGRFPMWTVIFGSSLGLVALSFLDVYRYSITQVGDPTAISVNAVQHSLNESLHAFTAGETSGGTKSGGAVQDSMSRLADGRSIAAVFRGVPSILPFSHGETYTGIIYYPIPRFLYPHKPTLGIPLNNELMPAQNSSSPLTLVGEAYLNFGWPGIIFIPIVAGYLSGWYDRIFLRRAKSAIWSAVYISMAVQVVRLPVANLGSWIGLFIKALLIAAILGRLWLFLTARTKLQRMSTAPCYTRQFGAADFSH